MNLPTQHMDVGLGGALAFLGGVVTNIAGQSAGPLDLTPHGGPLDAAHLLGYAMSIVLGLAPVVLKRWLSSRGAGDRARRGLLLDKASAARKAGDVARADALEAQADELTVKIAQEDALAGRLPDEQDRAKTR